MRIKIKEYHYCGILLYYIYLIPSTHHPKKIDQTFYEYENTLVNSGWCCLIVNCLTAL